MKKILGIDLGISYIAWTLTEQDTKDIKIVKNGLLAFTAAENPKTRESLALPRRLARSARKTNKRKKQRLHLIKDIFLKNNFIDNQFLNEHRHGDIKNNVWELRTKAIRTEITDQELFQIIYFIVKTRGYANEVSSDEDKEGRKVLSAISENTQNMKGFSTYGEYIYESNKENGVFRNKRGGYNKCISRGHLAHELRLILKTQKELGNKNITQDFIDEIIKIFYTNMGMQSIEKMVGFCKFEPLLKRASKANITTQKFLALTKIINLNILKDSTNEETGEVKTKKIPLKELVSIDEVLALAFKNKKVTYKTLRKFLAKKMDKEDRFGLISYSEEKNQEANTFISFEDYHKLNDAFGDIEIDVFSDSIIDKLMTALTYEKAFNKKKDAVMKILNENATKLKIDDETISKISSLSFSKFIELSKKIVASIVPYMLKGNLYHEAMLLAGYNHSKPTMVDKFRLLPVINQRDKKVINYYKAQSKSLESVDMEMTNPVANRAISKFRKLLNAIIRRYGTLDQIVISLDRELNSAKDRNEIKKNQGKDRDNKKAAIALVEESNELVNSSNIIKARLFLEQDSKSIYSDKPIDINRLFELGYTYVKHPLPISKSFDDSMSNKVLVLGSDLTIDGTSKGTMTPYEWLSYCGKFDEFETRVKAMKISKAKKGKLLRKTFDESAQNTYLQRQINDNRYIGRVIKQYLEDYLEFGSKGNNVVVVNGKIINKLRHFWGMNNVCEDGYESYKRDATITAFATRSMVQKLATYYNSLETSNEKDFPFFEKPYDGFKDDLIEHVTTSTTVKQPRKKVTGEAHSQLPRSKKNWISKTTGNSKPGVEINGGMCSEGEIKRVDIYKKDNQFYFQTLTVNDFAMKKFNKKAIGFKAELIDLDDSFEFVMKLFKDDLIDIGFSRRSGDIEYYNKVFFSSLAPSSGDLFILDSNNPVRSKFNGKGKCYGVVDIKKYSVNLLGDVF